MKYLLTAVDVANKMLNGEATDYDDSEYATDTDASIDAVKRLIKNRHMSHSFLLHCMAAALTLKCLRQVHLRLIGGNTETITRTNTTEDWVHTHTYTKTTRVRRTISIGGRATGVCWQRHNTIILF